MIKEITVETLRPVLDDIELTFETLVLELSYFNWVAVDIIPQRKRYTLWAYEGHPELEITDAKEYIWDSQSGISKLCSITFEQLVELFELSEQELVYHKLKPNSLAFCIKIKHD